MEHYIDPGRDLGAALLSVEKPARYSGGEYGRLAKRGAVLRMLAAFPDLYEIGMSNQALRILYNGLNRIEGISCDRVFAPAPDFEALLRERGVPLYGLDTGIPLGDTDALCFTLGHELGITGLLTMLDVSGIPLDKEKRRTGAYPLVILGGPCVSNPMPYERFIDAFWIGEAEAGFFELAGEMLALKKSGEGRGGLERLLAAHPSVWVSGKAGAARAVYAGFASGEPDAAVFPVSSMKTAQHHGAVEIMRGCPNGCRFCHAGVWYRPMRQKSAGTVRAEAGAFIKKGGYREISLSSLSTGDYRHIEDLVESLNREYAGAHVSFQLPSLRVSTFSLPLLEKVSAVRKSGLTFAVETPVDAWQLAINKEVSRDNVTAIIQEAKKRGWRSVKFYFMLGLPLGNPELPEEQEIASFIQDVSHRTGMRFHINIGTFVPKPHTSYQWAAQLDEQAAREKLDYLKRRLMPAGHKVSTHDPFVAVIEGLISRGGGGVGEVIAEAFTLGCRLDAWDDFLRKDLWRLLLEKHASLVTETLGGRGLEEPLPWDAIDSGASKAFLAGEWENSAACEATPPCEENGCGHPCGVCPGRGRVVRNAEAAGKPPESFPPVTDTAAWNPENSLKAGTERILFAFTKTGPAVWLPHLAVIEVFSMAMLRAGIPALFSQGFNPLPRLDFAAPLALGIAAAAEIATLDTEGFLEAAAFQERLNRELPEGFQIVQAENFLIPFGAKKHQAAALLWGFAYGRPDSGADCVQAADEKNYRRERIASGCTLYDLRREAVLARRPGAGDGGPESYFTVYGGLYGLPGNHICK